MNEGEFVSVSDPNLKFLVYEAFQNFKFVKLTFLSCFSLADFYLILSSFSIV